MPPSLALRPESVKKVCLAETRLVRTAPAVRRNSNSNGGGSPVISALKVTLPPATADWLAGESWNTGTTRGSPASGRQVEDSDVLFAGSVAVAVITEPIGNPSRRFTAK